MENPSEIDPQPFQKGNPKQDASLDGDGMALGTNFWQFWVDIGGQAGPNIQRKWDKNRHQNDKEKTKIKNPCEKYARSARQHAGNSGGGPQTARARVSLNSIGLV